ncbi:MAG: DUF4292 domain-containing protein [Deltaproteobacteria bacterium]|nr:DUF4292 domain-containing protein [Deltaproteobacteria bacterium]
MSAAPARARRAWLAALLLAAGCPRVPPPGLPHDAPGLLAAVEAARGKVRRVEGTARLGLEGQGGGSAEAFVAAERPGRLRIELLDFFGAPAALLVVSGGRFLHFDARRGTWTRGEATPASLARLLPLSLPVEEAVALLCGDVPLVNGAAVDASPGDGVMKLVLAEEGGTGRQQWLGVGAGAAVEWSRIVRLAEGGQVEPAGPAIRLSALAPRGAVRFPGQLRVERPPSPAVTLAWRGEPALDGPARPGAFSLEPPPGARVLDLPAGAEPGSLHLPLPGGE